MFSPLDKALITHEVFSKLTADQRKELRTYGSQARQAIDAGVRKIEAIQPSMHSQIDAFAVFPNLTNIEIATAPQHEVTACLQNLQQGSRRQTTQLELGNLPDTDYSLRDLTSLPNLKQLTIKHYPLEHDFNFGQSTALKSLHLKRSRIDAPVLNAPALAGITKLHLSNVRPSEIQEGPEQGGIALNLSEKKRLEKLELEDLSLASFIPPNSDSLMKVTLQDVDYKEGINLQGQLRLQWLAATNAALPQLDTTSFRSLQEIKLEAITSPSKDLDLSEAFQLRKLTLSETALSSFTLPSPSRLAELEIENCSIYSPTLELTNQNAIRDLLIKFCRPALLELPQSTALKNLKLASVRLTHDKLSLADKENLSALTISKVNISRLILPEISNLISISLTELPKYSSELDLSGQTKLQRLTVRDFTPRFIQLPAPGSLLPPDLDIGTKLAMGRAPKPNILSGEIVTNLAEPQDNALLTTP